MRRKKGLSEILGSLIMIAITLIAGAAVFGFVNGQAGNSANAVGKNAAANINFLNEREEILFAKIASPTSASVWVYNSGLISPMTLRTAYATPIGASGTATGGGLTYLTDNTKNWGANEWVGATVVITGGAGSGESETVSSNTATTLTVSTPWPTQPGSGSTYTVTTAPPITCTVPTSVQIFQNTDVELAITCPSSTFVQGTSYVIEVVGYYYSTAQVTVRY